MKKISGTVTALTRRLNSRSGNPRWTVFIDGTAYTTEPDAQVGHDIGHSWLERRVKAQVSGGRLVSIEVVPDGIRA